MKSIPQYEDRNTFQHSESSSWEKMAQEIKTDRPDQKVTEKSFFETNIEFTGDDFGKFRDELFNASPDEVKKIVGSRISILEENADKVERISPMRFDQHIHRGYISKDTAVSFEDAIGSQYKLRDPEYLYDAVNYLRDNKEHINNGRQFFEGVTRFLNSYFGIPNMNKDRWSIIEEKTNFASIQDDNEYWNAINNIDISVFKGEQVAQCSERSAMAQNIMSLFGYETYYVNGDISVDGANGGHAYNIVADMRGQKCLIDYSVTSSVECNGVSWDIPTMAKIDDYDSFVAGHHLETSNWHHIIQNDGKITHKRIHMLDYNAMQ